MECGHRKVGAESYHRIDIVTRPFHFWRPLRNFAGARGRLIVIRIPIHKAGIRWIKRIDLGIFLEIHQVSDHPSLRHSETVNVTFSFAALRICASISRAEIVSLGSPSSSSSSSSSCSAICESSSARGKGSVSSRLLLYALKKALGSTSPPVSKASAESALKVVRS